VLALFALTAAMLVYGLLAARPRTLPPLALGSS
jgi:hypothetical protein